MPVPQITIRLSPTTKERFEAYAERLGLDASELAKLLIMRERYRQRLASLAGKGRLPAKARRPAGDGERLPTVTAHLSSLEQVKTFDVYAHQCGLNRSTAGAHLLEAELDERWLERSLKG